MASGKKNYFRHSFFARNDDFVILLIDTMGYQGYFLWFGLLEICGEIAADNYPETFKIANSRLLRSLRCRQQKLDWFLTLARQESKLYWERIENNHFIQIHNFPKYLGKYENLNESNAPNKRKEKEIKEKKRKEKELGEHFLNIGVEETGIKNPRNNHGMQSLSDAIISGEISEILANLKQDDNYNVEQ